MSSFLSESASRETAPEIMEAIFDLAQGNPETASRIWDAPTDEDLSAIWKRVTKNGAIPSENYVWGAAGPHWADSVAEI